MLGAKMPVDVDWAHGRLPVGLRVGNKVDLHAALVALGNIGSGLGTRQAVRYK